MKHRRVVVTGMGMVSPLGNDVVSSWQQAINGESGISKIENLDLTGFSSQISGSVKNFDIEQYITAKEAKKLDTFIQYGIAAGMQAIQDANFVLQDKYKHQAGVVMGSGIGGLVNIEQTCKTLIDKGPHRVSPFFVPGSIINMLSGYLSLHLGFQGPNYAIATACTTSTHCIGMAARNIIYGDADIMLAGGAEFATCCLGIAGFAAARALSTRNDEPNKASRPWDKDRDGFVLADGAGALVLEELEHAKNRGAKIYAEVKGFGMSSDAYHMTLPSQNGAGAALCMSNALKDADLTAQSIDYINAHGTSTPSGDVAEVNAIKQVFGDHAYQIAISSTKSMTGHLLGAAGAIEAIFSILSLVNQVVLPTINLDNPDVECDLDFTPHKSSAKVINTVLSNSFGFGGTNGSLIFTKFND